MTGETTAYENVYRMAFDPNSAPVVAGFAVGAGDDTLDLCCAPEASPVFSAREAGPWDVALYSLWMPFCRSGTVGGYRGSNEYIRAAVGTFRMASIPGARTLLNTVRYSKYHHALSTLAIFF